MTVGDMGLFADQPSIHSLFNQQLVGSYLQVALDKRPKVFKICDSACDIYNMILDKVNLHVCPLKQTTGNSRHL
jgi:hypothetical protein